MKSSEQTTLASHAPRPLLSPQLNITREDNCAKVRISGRLNKEYIVTMSIHWLAANISEN